MKRSEASEQITLIQWCDINRCKYPELGLIFHIPNGGKRNKLEAIKLKKEGVKAGVPVILTAFEQWRYFFCI